MSASQKPRFATVWLGGCSGCHMSFLDIDEWVVDLIDLVDVVYTPIADIKTFPENVDIALVEGAVANEENLEMLHRVRDRSKMIVAFGDCAVTGNVTALRNPLGVASVVIDSVYLNHGDLNAQIPNRAGIVPILLDRVLPLHEAVTVDHYIHGCPPSASLIRAAIEGLLDSSKVVSESGVKFG